MLLLGMCSVSVIIVVISMLVVSRFISSVFSLVDNVCMIGGCICVGGYSFDMCVCI